MGLAEGVATRGEALGVANLAELVETGLAEGVALRVDMLGEGSGLGNKEGTGVAGVTFTADFDWLATSGLNVGFVREPI